MALLTPVDRRPARRPRLCELDGAPRLGHVPPNWFAAVMGTGIVAIALDGLPVGVPGSDAFAVAVWLFASMLLVIVSAATVLHHLHHPVAARAHRDHPVTMHFYGAPAMALMTVGAGAMVVGDTVIGADAALALDAVLWTVGTALGLATTVLVPLRMLARGDARADQAFGGWLMPVVPPMVSATTGALLVPHLPPGQAQETLLLACYLFFGLSLVISALVISLIWARLVGHGVGAAATVPTLWIALGPLGQSITAVHHLGALAPGVLPAPYGAAFASLALVYGVPVWGFTMLWMTIAAVVTFRTARAGMPFTLSWWSFTFPVGTVVTGTTGLALASGLVALDVVAVTLFGGLLAAWTLVATRSAHGVWTGRLLRA